MQRFIITVGFIAAGSLATKAQAQQNANSGPLLVPPSQGQRNDAAGSLRRPITDNGSAVRTLHYRPGRYDWDSNRYDWGDWNRGGNDRNDRYSGGYYNPGYRWNLSPFAPYEPRRAYDSRWDTRPYGGRRDGLNYGTSHRGYHGHNLQNLHDGHGHWPVASPGPHAGGPRVERTLELIDGWYRTYFGHPLRRWEASKWTSDLQRGMTREEIFATILSSAQWYQRAGGDARSWIRATLASLGELDARALPQWLVRFNNSGGDRRALADQMVARFGVQPARNVRPSVLARRDNWNDSRAERRREQRRRQRRRHRRNH